MFFFHVLVYLLFGTILDLQRNLMITMKSLLLFATLFLATMVSGQVNDSVITNSTNDAYYSLSSGQKNYSVFNNWDFAFATSSFDVSVLSNDAAGIEVYLASENVADWATLDTMGNTWRRLYNSESSWSMGSFCNMGTNHPDYGWGNYNQNHSVSAKRLFFVKLKNGEWRKMMIEKMETNGNFTFKMAKLDGSQERTSSFNKTNNNSYQFIHYNVSNDSFFAHEPISENWDLYFTKYHSMVAPGTYYPVSGVKIHASINVAQRDGLMVESDDTTGLSYSGNITEIGSDWKTYSSTTMSYTMAPDRVYFMELKNGDIWKLYFTKFVGGSVGGYYFTKEQLFSSASVSELARTFVVAPNPTNGQISVITHTKDAEISAIQIKDLNGKTVAQQNNLKSGLVENTLDLSAQNNGIYFVELIIDGKTYRKKLILTR